MSVPSTPAISVDSTYVASPRLPSPDSRSSSRRVSLDVPAQQSLNPHSPKPRRNRSALRQFYGLGQGSSLPEESPGKKQVEEKLSEIDREGFDAATYVQKFIAEAELKELLKRENELVNEIRGFDGERKALVYDNYSKLITATDTIRKMRANMEPLAPTTSTLGPAISHIAQVSASLVENIPPSPVAPNIPASNKRKKDAVVWALACPGRIEELVKTGRRDEAERVFGVLEGMLGKWKGVKGTKELREKAMAALGKEER
ncbi:Vps51/Vps67-domain-containing protein [Tuber borchii]|uniref:Vacuolar protein sorting-associated protein 51 homolog n=1 Tax=Tuber borchii TaxID=42251 RepID=A0A2T7A4Z6_TUBBO|nr:Vps51/Vps67-domain-containing protein [Tuber borchii]